MNFLKKYGVALGVFFFGFHLHAQAMGMWPFWEYVELYGSIYDADLLARRLGDKADNQMVTGRWLMLAGLGIWVGVRYGLFERLRGGSDKPSGEE
jgi:hypothetical protein